jgi:sterol 3beta-glucosyltransferase
MKIGLQTWGTDGDFFPFLALAIGLKNTGHEVTIAYTSIDGTDYSNRADVEGIQLIRANAKGSNSGDTNPYAIDAKAGSFGEYTQLLEQYFGPHSKAMYEASEKLCQENDLVIGHAVCHTLLTASEQFKCPRVSLVLTPLVVRSNAVSPVGVQLGSIINSFLWTVGGKVATSKWFKAAAEIRKREGLPPVKSLQKELFTSELLTLVAASEALTPRPKYWADTIQMTGFLNLPTDNSKWQMPADLQAFLDAGEPPIYMTFGSCMQFDVARSTKLLIEAAQRSGKRTIIQSDWEKIKKPTDPNIFCVTRIPHAEVFPYCALIVHHGGAGTTQAALLAGKPSVVVAHGFDQPYWGKQLETLGVGGKLLQRETTTPANLAEQIEAVLHSNAAEMAKLAGQKMAMEDGVAKAVASIHSLAIK